MKLKSAWNRFGRAAAFSAVICASVYAGCMVLRRIGALQSLEFTSYKRITRDRGHEPDTGNVVLVGVDEGDLRSLGHYPLTDQDKADLIQRLESFDVRAIGIDIYLDLRVNGEADRSGATTSPSVSAIEGLSGAESLKDQLTKNRNVICAEFWGDAKYSEPEIPAPAYVPRGRRVGFIDQPLDDDGVVRRAALYYTYQGPDDDSPDGTPEPSLSLNVANKFLEGAGMLVPDVKDPLHIIHFWPRIPKLDPRQGLYSNVETTSYQYLIKYNGPKHYNSYDLRQVMKQMDVAAGRKAFSGKAVIIGMTADSVKDKITTPIGEDTWGPEHHVRLVDQLIRIANGERPLGSISWQAAMWWTLLWTALAGIVGFHLRSVSRLALVALAGLAIIVGTGLAAARHDLLVPVVPPALCWLVSLAGVTAYMVQLESGDRRTIRELFGKAVQKEVADEMWERRAEVFGKSGLKPREGVATLLFSDLKGFTTLSEHMKPGDLIAWLNEYLTVMTDVVAANHGILNKYMGDGIMATFGMPIGRGDAQDAGNAVSCALQMRSKMSQLRARWDSEGRPSPKMRVGIFTGPCVAGSVGSPQRQEYTILGDTTNTASRLESFDKDLMDNEVAAGGCRILIGESTYKHVAQRVRVRYIGQCELKGRKQTAAIYGLLGPAQPADAASDKGDVPAMPDQKDDLASTAPVTTSTASESK